MARPRGFQLSTRAWDDVLRLTGRTLTQVATDAEMQRATVSGLLAGHSRASMPVAHKIAAVLGVHPETLFPTLMPNVSEETAA